MNSKRKSSTSSQQDLFPIPLSRQRTPSYSSSMTFSPMVNKSQEKDLAYLEKRSAHNALERQRREGLNSKFQELAHVLPALQQVKRPSKSTIVAKSLEFVSSAAQREVDFQEELSALREENMRLLAKVTPKKKPEKKRKRGSESLEASKKHKLDTRRRSSSSADPTETTSHLENAENSLSRTFEQYNLLDTFPFNMQHDLSYDNSFYYYKYS
ncbi:unnamed protein product [Rhizopus stolonifer]